MPDHSRRPHRPPTDQGAYPITTRIRRRIVVRINRLAWRVVVWSRLPGEGSDGKGPTQEKTSHEYTLNELRHAINVANRSTQREG